MGIHGLTGFVNKNFRRWKEANFKEWDHVIIDGHNVCCMLYRKSLPWALGGEYDKFSAKVEEFFIKYGFRNPIVVFDGASSDQSKVDTTRRRRKECMTDMLSIQSKPSWDINDISNDRILPLLIIATFINVLKKMGIKCYIADGEADKEMAALANHYKCPILGSDSDFFIFDLKYGFIHFNRLYCEGKSDSLFYIQDFQDQFGLRVYELCLVIPALFGNDFVKGKFYKHYLFFKNLSKYKSYREYYDNCESDMRVAPEDYDAVKAHYCDLKLPDCYTHSLEETPTSMFQLPEWLYSSYKTGNFPVPLLDIYLNHGCILPRVVEAIMYESAWKSSRFIRQSLYHIMGVPEVTEAIRMKSRAELTDDLVPAIGLNPPVSIHDDLFRTRNVDMLSNLVLEILKCHELLSEGGLKSEFNSLHDDFKLPIAATIYWYKNLDNPPSQRKLVMCLLISFLTCSKDLPKKPKPVRVTAYTKSDHLKALHALAQWQCVYYDAMSLNYVAREPFSTTSPACLYSGEVSMYYAFVSTQAEGWLDTIFIRGNSTWQFFNQLLYLVTGCKAC